MAYTYRVDGPRLSMADGTGTTTYTYDDAGRLRTQTQGLTGKTLTTAYVAGTNRRLSLSDGTQTWTTGYDAGVRPRTLAQTVGSGSPLTDTTYTASGAVQSQTFGNGTKTTYGYDARGRSLTVAHATTGGVAQQTLTTHYGADGNPDGTTDALVGVGTWSTAYAHDRADRLVGETRTGAPSGNYSTQYAYDGQGNRTSVVRNGTASYYGAAGPNDRFEYGEGYSTGDYDADGNVGTFYLPTGGVWGLYYDEGNRLLGIYAGLSATFRYDGDGRRVERVMGGATTRFVYDGDTVVEETGGTNAVTLYRTPGVGFVRNGTQRYEQDNALGSAMTIRDAAGSPNGQTEYDAYGREVWTGIQTDRGSYRFAGAKGYQNDDLSGMQLLGARFYLPVLGRFLTQDPIGQAGGLNLYAYCGDSPLLKVDPSGLEPYRYAVIAGDTHFYAMPMHIAYAGEVWRLRHEGNRVTTFNGPTREQFVSTLKGSYTGIVLWGHGRNARLDYDHPNSASLSVADINQISAYRNAHGIPKLAFIQVDSCNVMQDHTMVNALLKMAHVVIGYEGLTFDGARRGMGLRHLYTAPVPYQSNENSRGDYKKD